MSCTRRRRQSRRRIPQVRIDSPSAEREPISAPGRQCRDHSGGNRDHDNHGAIEPARQARGEVEPEPLQHERAGSEHARMDRRYAGDSGRPRENDRLRDQESEYHAWPGAHGSQHGHLPASFGETGQERRQQADEACGDHERADAEERRFRDSHQFPELLQRHARNDRHQRFALVLVDEPLKTEHHQARLEANDAGRDRVGFECSRDGAGGIDTQSRVLARVIGRVDRLDPGQRDVHGPVHRRPGAAQDAGDQERQFVVVLEAHVADAVGDDDAVADGVAEGIRDVRAEHGVVHAGEHLAFRELETSLPSKAVMGEVARVGAEHPKPPVRIAEGDGYGPGDARAGSRSPRSCPRRCCSSRRRCGTRSTGGG